MTRRIVKTPDIMLISLPLFLVKSVLIKLTIFYQSTLMNNAKSIIDHFGHRPSCESNSG